MKDDVSRPGSAPKQCPSNQSHRILVVDDESAVRMLLTAALVRCGYHVETAEDGAAAWDALQVKPFDLLVTDHNMPKMTGIELINHLRSAGMSLPVIMVTGELDERDLDRNPSLQVAAVVWKPFALREFLDTVASVLQTAEMSLSVLDSAPVGREKILGIA